MGNSSSPRFMNQDGLENLDFTFYEWACREDADVQRFDANLKERTHRVLRALAESSGTEEDGHEKNHRLSLDSLKEVTTSLLDMDREVMEVILQYKEDVWKNRDLFLLVEEFFDNSLATLEFCTAAESSIKLAKDNQLILHMALAKVPSNRQPDERELASILSDFELFCEAGDPFGDEFVRKFRAVQERHTLMLIKLRDKKRKLDKRLKNVKVWAKVSSILFAAAVAAVLICSVVAAAITAPPVVTAFAAVSSFPLTSLGAWMKSVWKGYESQIKAQSSVIQRMQFSTQITLDDLETIKSQVQHLRALLKSVMSTIEFACQQHDVVALNLAVEEINKRKLIFGRDLDDLQNHVDRVGNRIRQARAIVLQIITQRTR